MDPRRHEDPLDPIDGLTDELIGAIEASGPLLAWDDARFLRWAGRIARVQAARGALPLPSPARSLRHLEQLEPVTTDVFRCWPRGATAVANFRSSGTLARHRGRHALYRTDIYDRSAVASWDLLVARRFALSGLISLVPRASEAPDSSLAYMLSLLERTRFGDRCVHGLGPRGLDVPALRVGWGGLREREEGPLVLFTTTLAAEVLLEAELAGLSLPPGSLVLTTGGAKGQRRRVSAEGIERALARRFPDARIGAEYGMTELLSQAYRVGTEPFRLPPWCRVLALDPATGRRQPHGAPGLLRFVDLANTQSAVCVQTADRGVSHSDHTFTLLGRAAGAPLRGCSLTFEELAGDDDDDA
jgi:hypothetical protein